MSAGFRSPLAFWIGGARPAEAGARGLLAFWLGGAVAPAATNAGARSLLAFWIGGAATPQSVARIGGGADRKRRVGPSQARNEDEELMTLITAALHLFGERT